ncbi:MAG: hypothetical protein XD94_1318 [Mesotoga prima]|uniref:Uncharacterized protein n=1 Tax=Mesotoga prima TaxID=1184387 RepID=A0A124FY11_9BACT|nr:MAG: hypothetical protein XD94_1318 [Mesotoga prima]
MGMPLSKEIAEATPITCPMPADVGIILPALCPSKSLEKHLPAIFRLSKSLLMSVPKGIS